MAQGDQNSTNAGTGTTPDSSSSDEREKHRRALILACIPAGAAVIVAIVAGIFGLATSDGKTETPPGPGPVSPPVPATSPPSPSSSGRTTPTTSPPTSGSPTKSPKPNSPVAKRWEGKADLPLERDGVSDLGLDVDKPHPSLVSVGADLNTGWFASEAIVVNSGRVVEVAGTADTVDRDTCVAQLPTSAREEEWVDAWRGNQPIGTFCFASTEGAVGVFSIDSVGPHPAYPQYVRIKVVVWE
ncbi:hypothetical protein [Streptomyces bugieae]|uniref:Uncharacterized protein n=1 Tax=Streptomyces bugieae TaxID=3098223 RepID=A0ABU7NFZ4_9ACTN|nr:hypothetical protein [Streptomyces sp. DSM 41528]